MLNTSLWKNKPGDRKIPGIQVDHVHESVVGRSGIFFSFFFYFLREGKRRYKYKLESSVGGHETRWKLSNSNHFQFGFSKPNLSSSRSSESEMAERKYEETQCCSPGLQRPPVFQLYFMDICIIQSFNHERTKEAERILFAGFETCVHMAWLLHVTQSFKTATPRPSAAPACAQEVSPGFFHAYLQCQVMNDPDTGVHQGPILSRRTHTQVGGDQTDSWSWAMRRTTSVRWVLCLQLECARHPEKGSELVRLVDSTTRNPDSVNIKWRSPLTCKLGSWTGTSFVLLLLLLLLLLLINIISFS